MRPDSPPRLLDDTTLERSSVVANNAMNRNRGLSGVNSYTRDLGFDPYQRLADTVHADPEASISWIDMCCGSGRALLEAEQRFAQDLPTANIALLGIDLVDHFHTPPRTPRLRLITANANTWRPEAPAAPHFAATYLGADDTAGPGYTGQPAVASYYDW